MKRREKYENIKAYIQKHGLSAYYLQGWFIFVMQYLDDYIELYDMHDVDIQEPAPVSEKAEIKISENVRAALARDLK